MIREGEQLEVTRDVRKSRRSAGDRVLYLLRRSNNLATVNWERPPNERGLNSDFPGLLERVIVLASRTFLPFHGH